VPATIFAGSKVKALKGTMSLNGGADIISSATDPTSVAVDASPGSLLLNTTSGKLYRKNDSGSSTNWSEVGSGGSGINYVTNPNASTNTTGWATYADAAGTAPVDGTGGSPTVTWTRSTGTPLRGAADFNFTKDAANRQGEGVATDITIDLADQAKVLTVSFDYEVLSGTYATGDLTVYLIADPAGTPVVIQPAGYQVQAATAGTKMRQIATFQTQATGQTYRVCFHVASTSASAYALAVDNVVVGPQTVQYGAPVTDWVDSGAITITGSTTNPTKGTTTKDSAKWRRVGDSMEILYEFAQSTAGTAGSGDYRLGIPSGFTIDSNKIEIANSMPKGTCGVFTLRSSGSYYEGQVHTATSTSLFCSFIDTAQSTGLVKLLGSTDAAFNNNPLQFTAVVRVPILGWSSTVQMSNDTDTRVVSAQATGVVTGGAGAGQILVFPTSNWDTHGAYNISTGRFTVPVSGYYRVHGFINTSSSTMNFPGIYKNGVNAATAGIFTAGAGSFTGQVYANAGDLLDLRPTSGALTTGATSWINFERLSGPSAIAATETVACKYQNTAGTTITTPVATIPFATKVYDTHGSYNGTTFVAPVSGVYLLKSSIYVSTLIMTTTQGIVLRALVTSTPEGLSGSEVILDYRWGGGANREEFLFGSKQFKLAAGDTIAIRAISSVATTLQNSGQNNDIEIVKVGNY